MPLKLYCAKRKPYVNSVQKRRRLLWARRHLGWTITQWNVYCGQMNQYFRYFLGGMDTVCAPDQEEKDHPDCYQQQVQKPGSVMVWGCVSALGKGNLHFCDGTINAEKYIEILEHNMHYKVVNALLSQLFLECVAGLNDRKGCIFTNDMKLTRKNMKYFVFILSAMKYKSK